MFGEVRKMLGELLGLLGSLATKVQESLASLQDLKKDIQGLSAKMEEILKEVERFSGNIDRLAFEIGELKKKIAVSQKEEGKKVLFIDGDYLRHLLRYQLPDWRLSFPRTCRILAQTYGKLDTVKSFWEFIPSETFAIALQRARIEIILCPPSQEGAKGTTDEVIIGKVQELPPGSTLLLLTGDKLLAEKAQAIVEQKGGEFHQLFIDLLTTPPCLRGKDVTVPLYQEKPEKTKETLSFWDKVYQVLTIGPRKFDFHEEFFLWVASKVLEIVPSSSLPGKGEQRPRTLNNLATLLWEMYYTPGEERVSEVDVRMILKVLLDNGLLREKKEGVYTFLYRAPYREWGKLKGHLPLFKE
jgi:hypothetical protein